MAETKPMEGGGCCEPECGSTTCGSMEEKSEKELPVVAGGSEGGCCEPDCSPETCG